MGLLAFAIGAVLFACNHELSDAMFDRLPITVRARRRDVRAVCLVVGIALTILGVYGLAAHNA